MSSLRICAIVYETQCLAEMTTVKSQNNTIMGSAGRRIGFAYVASLLCVSVSLSLSLTPRDAGNLIVAFVA